MEENHAFEQDLASIHKLMERSVKFISLSGFSGILSGVYGLIGAGVAYYRLTGSTNFFERISLQGLEPAALRGLFLIGLLVLVASLFTGVWLSARKARRMGIKVWDATGRRLIVNLGIPLFTGGLFILILAWGGYMEIVAGVCLIFYGVALVNASSNLFDEVRYLGFSEIILGLAATAIPGYGLILWAIGFGILHIIYGAAMYRKYDR